MGGCFQFMTRPSAEQAEQAEPAAAAPLVADPLEDTLCKPVEDDRDWSLWFNIPRSHTPCTCCFYTLSQSASGKYGMGWRKFGGQWSWWHEGLPASGATPLVTILLGRHASAATTVSSLLDQQGLDGIAMPILIGGGRKPMLHMPLASTGLGKWMMLASCRTLRLWALKDQ